MYIYTLNVLQTGSYQYCQTTKPEETFSNALFEKSRVINIAYIQFADPKAPLTKPLKYQAVVSSTSHIIYVS